MLSGVRTGEGMSNEDKVEGEDTVGEGEAELWFILSIGQWTSCRISNLNDISEL